MTSSDVPAYYEVRKGKVIFEGLCEHSLKTAAVGLLIFKDELELHNLVEEFVVAALLHDVGKANEEVLKKYEKLKKSGKNGKLSFKCHEVLSAQVVLELHSLFEGTKPDRDAVFYAVLRHHHAMRELEECKDYIAPLGDVGLLGELLPELKGLRGTKANISKIDDRARKLEDKEALLGKGFVLAGFLSLADSVAATLARRADSTQKPSSYVRRALEERGLTLERVREGLEEPFQEVCDIIARLSKDTSPSTCSSCNI